MKEKRKSNKRYNYTKFVVIGVLVGLFGLFSTPFAMAVSLYSWDIGTGIVSLGDDYMINNNLQTGNIFGAFSWLDNTQTIQERIFGNSYLEFKYGGSSSDFRDLLYRNGARGVTSGYICFRGTSGDCSQRYNYNNLNVDPITDDFNAIITLPDTTVIQTGYDYNGGSFGDINIKIIGTNQIGLYDNIVVNVLKDGVSYLVGFSSGFNLSCINCELANFNLSEIGTFTQYHTYTFEILMTSPLTNTITKSYNIGYAYTENIIDYDDCITGDLFCYMKNAFKWAFTVPPSTFDKFIELKTQIQTKAPFGYATSAYNVINGINSTGVGTYELEQVTPITNTIFTPIRNGLTWLLYFLFIFSIIKRFKTIEI